MSLKLLFYSDAHVWGGHELMLTNILEALIENPQLQLSLICSKQNKKLMDWASSVTPRIKLLPIEFSTQSLNNATPLLRIDRVLRVAKILRQVQPHKVVIVQGRIELGIAGLVASRLSGFYTISYIPMVHLVSRFSKAGLTQLRDFVNCFLYRLPHCYVTISGSIAEDIHRLSKRPVYVLPNTVRPLKPTLLSKTEARNALGLPVDGNLLSVIGRLEVGQKGQDTAIAALKILRSHGYPARLLIVGDGDHHGFLTNMAEKAGLGTHVFFRPWTPLVSDIYTASDLVLMPSRFEGVPLVMLEALMAGRPVAAAGVDGMRDYLPPEWLVSPLTGQTMAHRAIQILNDPLLDQKICKARDFVLAQTSPELFKSTAIRLFVDLPRS